MQARVSTTDAQITKMFTSPAVFYFYVLEMELRNFTKSKMHAPSVIPEIRIDYKTILVY